MKRRILHYIIVVLIYVFLYIICSLIIMQYEDSRSFDNPWGEEMGTIIIVSYMINLYLINFPIGILLILTNRAEMLQYFIIPNAVLTYYFIIELVKLIKQKINK